MRFVFDRLKRLNIDPIFIDDESCHCKAYPDLISDIICTKISVLTYLELWHNPEKLVLGNEQLEKDGDFWAIIVICFNFCFL